MATLIKADENGMLFSTEKTPKTTVEFMRAVILALGSENVNKRAVCLFTAQSISECGWGWKSMYGNNVGNEKHMIFSPERKYHMLSNVWEIENGKRVIYQPPSKQCWFKHFETLEEGMRSHIALLQSRPSFRRAFEAIFKGDEKAFVLALHSGRYFTQDPAIYLSTISSVLNKLLNSDAYEIAMETRNDLDPVVIFADEEE